MGHGHTLYLVRHAKAGERRTWVGDDRDRPLSHKGERQAEALAERLLRKGATALYSSDYLRCVQTLEPLGGRLGVEVAIDKRLAEDEPFEPVLDLLAEVEDGAVLCSHGDIIPATVRALHRRGMEVDTPSDWRKASVWVLRRKGRTITRGKVWPPPVH
ncbi:MAG: phosphoglycerate mutase family protein [Actinomycetota bacterium]